MGTDLKSRALNFIREGIEEYYSDVTDVTDANLKNSEMASYPKNIVADYKKDYNIVERLYDKCDAAFDDLEKNEVTASRIRKTEGALSAFHTAIMVLEESNGMFSAHLKHKTASQAAGIVLLFTLIIKGQQAQVKKLLADIPKIEKDLKKAKREVTGAKAQFAVNVAITGISALLPGLKGAQMVYLALGTAATRLAADAALGPTGPTEASAAKTVALEYGSALEGVSKGAGKLVTALGAVDAVVADTKEIGKAEKTLKQVKKSLQDTQRRYDKLEAEMRGSNSTLQKLGPKYEKAAKAAADAASKFKASKQKRIDLKKELAE